MINLFRKNSSAIFLKYLDMKIIVPVRKICILQSTQAAFVFIDTFIGYSLQINMYQGILHGILINIRKNLYTVNL